jgi:hypothetical protein
MLAEDKGFPRERAAQVALRTVHWFMSCYDAVIDKVVIACRVQSASLCCVALFFMCIYTRHCMHTYVPIHVSRTCVAAEGLDLNQRMPLPGQMCPLGDVLFLLTKQNDADWHALQLAAKIYFPRTEEVSCLAPWPHLLHAHASNP